jgi:hypothetical protein
MRLEAPTYDKKRLPAPNAMETKLPPTGSALTDRTEVVTPEALR